MILEPSLSFLSFLLEELSATSTRNDRFLWKQRLSGGSPGSSMPGTAPVNAIVGRAEGLSSVGTTDVGSRTRQFGNHRACAGATVP